MPASEHRAVREAAASDREFFRVFVENAQRTWDPIWCLERGLRISPSVPDVRGWFSSESL
jgi:hypothetical protein